MIDINNVAGQCDDAILNKDESEVNSLIETLKSYILEEASSENQCYAHYLLGNLYNSLFIIYNEPVSGWRYEEYPTNLNSEINQLRQAAKFLPDNYSDLKIRISINLANALAHQRRSIEVLEDYQPNFDIKGETPFVAAYAKARELIFISQCLSDSSHTHLYQYEAFLLLQKLKKNLPKMDYPELAKAIENNEVTNLLLKKGESFFKPLSGWQERHNNPDLYSPEERQYRKWCLDNRLFVNPINDLTLSWIADHDVLQFPNYTVSVGEGPFLSAAFSALKREYCFARHLAYEGFNGIHPQYENEKLFLVDTLDYVQYGGDIEKIKTAFRVCFSVLDSLAALMNVYFQCKSESVSFTPTWIRKHFNDKENNHFIDALFWLSCDLFDNDDIVSNKNKWKAPNPAASKIRKLRNVIEHGWLRVADAKSNIWNGHNDFAYIITPQELQEHTLFLLKLVRSAMLYFCMGVKINEEKQEKDCPDEFIAQLPLDLVDDEFISFG